MATKFADVYNRFLGKITDDMYVELTPEDTIKDLRNLLIAALPGFEFPRIDLFKYTVEEEIKNKEDTDETDFIFGTVWVDISDEEDEPGQQVMVETSTFEADLTSEEINILAILMMVGWLQRQITSIENVRMKYSGSDFKMTSQANHLSKLQTLLTECHRQSHHMQRLYKRRRFTQDNLYRSNWDVFRRTSALSYQAGFAGYQSHASHHHSSTGAGNKPPHAPDKECKINWGEI